MALLPSGCMHSHNPPPIGNKPKGLRERRSQGDAQNFEILLLQFAPLFRGYTKLQVGVKEGIRVHSPPLPFTHAPLPYPTSPPKKQKRKKNLKHSCEKRA